MLARMGVSGPIRRIYLLGALQIEGQSGSIAIPAGNAQNLFAYLALTPGRHTRERLATLFWPDAPPGRVGRYFSNLIYRLRQSLGEDWLEIHDEYVALKTGQDLWVDVFEFESLLASGDQDAARRALDLYRGDLLPEIYADWILPRRVALREKYLAALARLAQSAEDARHLDQAFDHYHRLANEDPLHETARRGLMRIYTQMGRHTAALGEFERLTALLAEELGVEPVPETQALAGAIRADHEARYSTEAVKPSFLGRRQERAALLRAVDNARNGRGGLVLMEGEAGMGKTRLLEMAADGAAWRGATVVRGKAAEFSASTPYAPLDEALQNAITAPQAAFLQSRLSPPHLEALAAFAPLLRDRFGDAPSVSPDLPTALGEGLAALSETAPLLILLDDVQWAGAAFWDVLPFVRRLKNSSVLIVLAYRPEGIRANPTAWARLQDIDLETTPLRLELRGLDMPACEDLARELGHSPSPEQIEALHTLTQGNPLYLQEALAAPSTGQGLPSSLALLLQNRLASLSANERNALEIAAVLGSEFSHGSWQAIGGMMVMKAIPELLAARFIEETPRGYQFQHDLIRQQVYQAIEIDRQRWLHRQAAQVLAGEHASPEILAWHYERGEAWDQAIRYHRQAGGHAARAYAYQAALEHYEQGIALLEKLPQAPAVRLALLLRRQRVLRLLARLEAWRADVDEIERLAVELGDTDALLEALEARLRLTNIASEMAALRAAIVRAVELAPEAGDPALEARMLNTAGFYLSDSLGEHLEAMPLLHRAVDLSETAHETALYIEALCNLAFAQWASGACQAAHESAARALATAEMSRGHFPARAHALASLGQVAMGLARWEQSRESLAKAIDIYTELSDAWNLGDTLYNFAIAASAMGQHAEAIQAAERLLNLAQQVGLPSDSDLAIWYQTLLLRVYTEAGDLTGAGRIRLIVEKAINGMQDGRALITALTAIGAALLAEEHFQGAAGLLDRAVRLWRSTQNFGDVLCTLLHAIAAHRAADFPMAQASLALADAALGRSDGRYHRVLHEYARFIVLGDETALSAARAEIQSQAAAIENPDLRRAFLTDVRLHRAVEAEWANYSVGAGPPGITLHNQVFLLARRESPLGRPLTQAEKVAVRWTLDAGEADAAILRQQGKVVLRRQRLRRLLAEAYAQGAAPTDADLAQALRVSRRTILRDIAFLQASGEALSTRRRRGQSTAGDE